MKLIHKLSSHTLPIVVMGVFAMVVLFAFAHTASAATIATDNFNDGIILDDGWSSAYFESPDSNSVSGDVNAEAAGDYNNEGYSAKIDDDIGIYRQVTTTGYQNLQFSFCRRTSSVQDDDYLRAGWKTGNFSSNWSNWTTVETIIHEDSWSCKTFNLPSSANNTTIYIGFFMDSEESDYGWMDNVTVSGTQSTATISAKKIVCENESDLPNWGAGSSNITSSTAANFIASHPNCHLADWTFQWRPDNTEPYNPGDNTTTASGAWSTPFSSTVSIPLTNSKIWVREVWNSDYIQFSGDYTEPIDQDVSAEFYCNTDVVNYDNLEWIDNMQSDHTYYCVGFNVLNTVPVTFQKVVDKGDPNDWTFTYDGHTYNNGETVNLPPGGDIVTENGPDGYSFVSASGICSEDGNVYINITGDGGTCTFTNKQNTYDLHGKKWNDLDGDGFRDEGEPTMNGWTVFIDENDNGILDGEEQSKITKTLDDQDGWYIFTGLFSGNYTICEVPQAGWNQTYPKNCHTVTLPNDDPQTQNSILAPEYNFGNKVNPVQVQGLGLTKSANPTTTNPLTIVTYTIGWSVTGNSQSTGVVLTDPIPTNVNFTSAANGGVYDSTTKIITWDLGTKNPGDSGSVSWVGQVAASAPAGNIVNTASIDSNESDPAISAVATVAVIVPVVPPVVRTPIVLGEETFPALSIDKSVNVKVANPGQTITYTVIVTNTGDAVAEDVVIIDHIAPGLQFMDTVAPTHTWLLGDIMAGDSVTTTYDVIVLNDNEDGIYPNTAEAWAVGLDNVYDTAEVEIRNVKVLGAETLPTTGSSMMTFVYLIASVLVIVFTGYVLKLTVVKK